MMPLGMVKFTLGIWRYMVCFYDFERDYIIGLISVESFTFGLLTFLRFLETMGTFEIGAHVFYMFKYDPYILIV